MLDLAIDYEITGYIKNANYTYWYNKILLLVLVAYRLMSKIISDVYNYIHYMQADTRRSEWNVEIDRRI